MNWRTTCCYFDENRKVMNKKLVENGHYVIDRKEVKVKDESSISKVKIINYYCKRNPQTRLF